MKIFLTQLALAFALFISVSSSAQTSKVISGSTNFSIKFALGTCNGTFDAPKGKAIFDESKAEASSFDITIAAASFKTNVNSRDKDMKSEDYFFVSKYPNIHFKSSKVEKKGNSYQADGIMTIRDVSKNVTLPFEAKKNSDGSYALTSTFEINRLDYKIGEKNWKLRDVATVNLKAVIR